MYRRILVPSDGSPVSEAAVDAAIDFAQARGSEIVALGAAVPEPSFQPLEGAVAYDPGLQVEVLLDHARKHVDAIATRAQKAGMPCTPVTCSALDAAEAILDNARQRHRDLILMGSHGRPGPGRLPAGSVTQAVPAHAPAPVMLLRPAAHEDGSQARPQSGPAGVL